MTTGKLFRENLSCNSVEQEAITKIATSVLAHCSGKPVFPTLRSHMYDTSPLENHQLLLIKAVAETYLQVRYTYEGKQVTRKLAGNIKVKSRQVYTKLIHFSGQ